MDFAYTDEQRQLQETLLRYIAKEYGFAARRQLALSEHGYSREHWRAFADLGILALTVPEAHGGLSGTAIDTMIVMEALGRGLVLEPYLATAVVCGGLIADAGSAAQQAELLPRVAGGELVLALAHHKPGRATTSTTSPRPRAPTARATSSRAARRLSLPARRPTA